MAKLFGKTIKYLYLLCFLILLILNSSILFAVHWSPDTGITLSGTYTRFVPRGSPVSFSANAMDRDKYTETNNNYGYDYYSFTVNSDTSDWTWDIPGLTEISQHSSFYSSTYNTSFSGRTTENTPCGDYTVSVTADDNSSIGQNDTGSRNDSAVSQQLTATVYDMILSYTPNAACTINNTTHPLVIRPINNDDDNNNLTEDNQETNITGEDDLIPVEITVTPNNTSVNTYMKLRISGSEVRVFANADRSGEYNINSTNGTEINLSSLTGNESSKSITFYIEPQSCLWGTFTAYLYPDYTDEPNTLWHSDMMFNMGGITKTVYVANSGVNIREYNNYNDQNEMISPGMVIGKYDELNRETKSLALNTSLTNEITDYSVTICKNNNNIKLFYTTYNNNTFASEETEITDNTTFEKNNIPNIKVKGLEPGSTVVTAKLNIKEINGETCNLTDFHSDSMLINTVCANTGITGFNDANENTSPGYTLGLNRSNVINFSVANTDNTYTGYKAVIQVPNNIELYTDENLTDVAQREYTIGTDTLPSTLYMKGVQGTQGTVTYSFYSPSNALIHKDSLKTDVVYCDLKTDSNNDGYIDVNNNTDESIEETYPGKYIPCNTDDDNMSGIEDRYDTLPDNNNSGYLMGDGELKEIKLFSPIAYNYYPMGQNPYAGFKLKLTYSDNLKLYKNTSKFEQNMNPATWEFVYTDVCIPSDTVYTVGTDTPPESLYIEGIGNGQGEINYTVYDANNNEVYNDRVVVTVVDCDLSHVPDIGHNENFSISVFSELLYVHKNLSKTIELKYVEKDLLDANADCCLRLYWDDNVEIYTDQILSNKIESESNTELYKTWYIGNNVPSMLYVKYVSSGTDTAHLYLTLNYNNSGSLVLISDDSIQFAPVSDLVCFDFLQQGLSGSGTVNWYDYYSNVSLDDYTPPITDPEYLSNVYGYQYFGRWHNYDAPNDGYAENNGFNPFSYTPANITLNTDNVTYDKNRPFLISLNDNLRLSYAKFYKESGYLPFGFINATTNLGFSYYDYDYEFTNGFSTDNIHGLIGTYEKFGIVFTGQPSAVDFANLIIDWKHGSTVIGETRHPLYITFDTPIGNGPYNETCVWLGCTAARGKTTEESVFNAIWNKFQSMNVTTRDGRLLSYYKYGDNAGNVTELNGLLVSGNGQCASWADLFQKVIYAQGINSIYKYVIDIKNNKNIYINDGLYDLIGIKQKNTKFQGNKDNGYIGPNIDFIRHIFNIYDNKIYDTTMQCVGGVDINTYLNDNILLIFDNKNGDKKYINPNDYNHSYSEYLDLNTIY